MNFSEPFKNIPLQVLSLEETKSGTTKVRVAYLNREGEVRTYDWYFTNKGFSSQRVERRKT